jgi:phospholipase C
MNLNRKVMGSLAVTIALGAVVPTAFAASSPATESTTTPIQHVVVIFQENVSFDHYFGTYPVAANLPSEPVFHAAPGTPSVNGLNDALLKNNLNKANPTRLDRSQPMTDDMDHDYTAEQKAFDGGLMDKFVENTGAGSWPIPNQDPATVMDYYDGNTVTAMWNYAQHYAMSDNSFGTTFGPSTPGALNLVSGQTHGAIGYTAPQNQNGQKISPDANGVIINGTLNQSGSMIGDADPYFDSASNPKKPTVALTGKNVGDLLNGKGITWGWFQGGFRNPTHQSTNVSGSSVTDYSPHHEPFQYYAQTANPNHLPPTSTHMIGRQDQANHQYDVSDFWTAADAGNMPAVSFLKAPMYEDGHAGYSDPLDEQQFLVNTLNHLQSLPSWKNTAVIISYDDSDGWYDHVMGPIVNPSNDPSVDAIGGTPKQGAYLDRAGYGPRLPLMVISPYAKHNFVDHSVTDQSSILRFIEDNWSLGRLGDQSFDALAGSLTNMFDFSKGHGNSKLSLDPATGEPKLTSSPVQLHGKSYMKLTDFTQAADIEFNQHGSLLTFQYNGLNVNCPMFGHSVQVNGATVELGANLMTVNGALYVPVDGLAAALGIHTLWNNGQVQFTPPSP